MILTHYYPLPCQVATICGPLGTNILEYNEEEQHVLAERLSHYPGRALRRFNRFDEYVCQRSKTETWLYSSFVNVGGQPILQHPLYFVLGEDDRLRQDFGAGTKAIRIDTERLNAAALSFTLGDSVGLYFSSAAKKLYLLDQIESISTDIAFLHNQMAPLKHYHRYIEAQLWDKQYLDNAMIIDDYPLLYRLEILYYTFLLISTPSPQKTPLGLACEFSTASPYM